MVSRRIVTPGMIKASSTIHASVSIASCLWEPPSWYKQIWDRPVSSGWHTLRIVPRQRSYQHRWTGFLAGRRNRAAVSPGVIAGRPLPRVAFRPGQSRNATRRCGGVATRDAPAGVPLTSVQPDDYPRLSREGLGALKFNWRKANVKDDWTKGGSLSHAWDRVTGWPYWKKPSYDLDYGMRVLAKIAQEIPAWREVVGRSADLLTSRMPQYAAWFDWVEEVGH